MFQDLSNIKKKAIKIAPYIEISISILYGSTLIGLMFSQVPIGYTTCFFVIPTFIRCIAKMELDTRNKEDERLKAHWFSVLMGIIDPSQAYFAKIFPTMVAALLCKNFDMSCEVSLNLSLGFIRVLGHPFISFSIGQIIKKVQGGYSYEKHRPKFYIPLALSVMKQMSHIIPFLLLSLVHMPDNVLWLTSMTTGRFFWSVIKHSISRKRLESQEDMWTIIDPLYCFILGSSFGCASLIGHTIADQVGIALLELDISINSIMMSFILYYVQCIFRDLTYKALKYTSHELGFKTPILS